MGDDTTARFLAALTDPTSTVTRCSICGFVEVISGPAVDATDEPEAFICPNCDLA